MKIKNILAVGALAVALATPLFAQEQASSQQTLSPVNVQISINHLSDYVLHGLPFSNKPVVQTTASVNWKNLTGIVFTNYDGDMQPGEINEVDWGINYTTQVGKAAISMGYFNLSYPRTIFPDAHEVYAGVSIDTVLEPTLFVFQEFGGEVGRLTELSVGGFVGKKSKGVDIRGVLNHNTSYWREGSGLGNAELRFSVPFQLGKHWSIIPQINYSNALSPDFHDGFYSGLKVTFSK